MGLICAGLWGGEALIHRADLAGQSDRKGQSYRAYELSSRHDDSLSFAKAEMATVRHVALLLGCGVWFVAMVTMFFARPWRRQIAQVCLAGVIIAAVAWSVSPTRTWQRSSFFAPLPIGIAAGGLISLLALAIPARYCERRASDCAGCGYDLTGNRSGICPECGRPTRRKLAERWEEQAEQLRTVAADEPLGFRELSL